MGLPNLPHITTVRLHISIQVVNILMAPLSRPQARRVLALQSPTGRTPTECARASGHIACATLLATTEAHLGGPLYLTFELIDPLGAVLIHQTTGCGRRFCP